MKIKVIYYASFRDIMGRKSDLLELSEGIKVVELREKISKILNLEEKDILVAINGSFADPNKKIHEGDKVSLFPPVSGG
jgi:molybdopterin converting factor small subunit